MIFMGFASFFNDLVMPGAWAACMDIGGRYAGTLAGSMNMMGNVAGFVAPMVGGTILESQQAGNRRQRLESVPLRDGRGVPARYAGVAVHRPGNVNRPPGSSLVCREAHCAMEQPVRVTMFAIAAGAALLVGFMYLPPLFRPGVSVSRFRHLPFALAIDLNLRGCNIVRGSDVISEDFDGTGQRDWAVLCQQGNQASLLIYLAGSGKPSVYGTHGGGLVDDPESSRGIRVADWNYVAQHNPGIRPASPPKTCIEDGVGMGSSIYCYLNGAWVGLAGAD